MHLYLLENDQTVDLMLSSRSYTAGQDVIICFNYLCYLRLKDEKETHQFYFVEELINAKEYQQLHAITDEFAQNWYKLSGSDQTVHDGISYGELVEIVFSRKYMASILVKYGEIINKAVQKWPNIKTIYYDFSNRENFFYLDADDRGNFFNKEMLVQIVAKQLGLEACHIEVYALIPSAHVVHKPSPLQIRHPDRRWCLPSSVLFQN